MARASTSSRSFRKSGSSRAKKAARKSPRKSARKSPAKGTARKSAAKSSSERPHSVLFADLDSELATTRRMLERVPEGQNDWRPHAKSRTLGELATHLAQLPGFGLVMCTRDEYDGLAPRPPEARVTTSAERVRMFDQLSEQLRQTLQQMTWDQANSRWKLRLGDKIVFDAPRKQILRTAFVTHSAHHRAQLGVYLRMLDTPVPWSYGRSADEEPTGIM